MIKKSATYIGKLRFTTNDNWLEFWTSRNTNTGERQIWQRLNGLNSRIYRNTGKNAHRLIVELSDAIAHGELVWIDNQETGETILNFLLTPRGT